MIDIEAEVFTTVANAIRAVYPDAYVTGEYVNDPPKFPAVYIEERDNFVLRRTQDTGCMENDADLMYEVNIFSNKNRGRKAECRAIAAIVDEAFAGMNFTRNYLNPVPNMDDATIYRIVGRYRATVSKDKVIYRR